MRAKKVEERDVVLENMLLFVRCGLEIRAYYKAVRGGDVGLMERIMEAWGVQFVGSRQSNYGDALMDIRAGMLVEWNAELKKVVRGNWVINPWGRPGKTLGLDEFMEEMVRNLKDLYNPGGSVVLDKYARETVARNIFYFMRVKEEIRTSMGVRRYSGHHVKQDRSGDVLALVDWLVGEKVTQFVAGRGKVGDIGIVDEAEDFQGAGGERLVDGEWWDEFLMRSPGCVRAMRNTCRGLSSIRNVEQYNGDLFK
ncbi:hypothetical protein L211DRAFT_791404 [Terfezia boudieri ATCC MYA-4762]|uniref:DUF6589 domain-containing protein n=1 Tax=Terfezia boudieri ATCC MYA-4762 TaxID=1051890 RepID=A0A3N4LSC8_9PEZI|nr:hypothetical protein L211DRAFT_791404 [Terfezia boudieri ATCC MYA-4762]